MAWTNRSDHVTAAMIDRALEMATNDGTSFGWAYLARHGISESSIMRILGQHRRARAYAGAVAQRAHDPVGAAMPS